MAVGRSVIVVTSLVAGLGLVAGLAGCGRAAFDPLADAARDAAPPDAPPTGVVQLAAGGKTSCARYADGTVWCWGLATGGRLGNGETSGFSAAPIQVALPERAIGIEAGDGGVCAILATTGLACWGPNSAGQFGLGDMKVHATPARVPNLTDVASLAIGTDFICVRHGDGSVECAGEALELGDDATADRAAFAIVPGLDQVIGLTAGDDHVCALRAPGDVHCWGMNPSGALGDGTMMDRSAPAPGPFGPYTAIAAGDTFTCAIRGGAVDCWGDDTHGQLGDDAGTRPTAAPVAGITDATAILGAALGACVILADRSVRCWGDNQYGQLGDGTTDPHTAPAPAQISDVVEIVSRTDLHVCARLRSSKVVCWGRNEYGQLGLPPGDANAHPLPSPVIGLP